MGKIKLTLTVEERIVVNAKLQAKKQRKSLSALIEELLTLADDSQPETLPTTPIAIALRGSAKELMSQKTSKQIQTMMYKDRYNL